MTLDEAIKQCHQIIHNKTVEAETLKDGYEVFARDCLDSVEVHKQLAEWLQELKELRENKGKIIEAVYVVTTILVNMKATNIIAQCFLCMLIQMIFAVMQKGEKMSDSINRQAAMSL